MLSFYGFVPVALGGLGNNRGAVHRRARARPVPAGGELPRRRRVRLGGGVRRVHRRPAGGRRKGCSARRRRGGCDGARPRDPACRIAAGRRGTVRLAATAAAVRCCSRSPCAWPAVLRQRLLGADRDTGAAIYWVLVSGLNLVVGFGGQLAIGYVALLTLGAYTASVLVAGHCGAGGLALCRSRRCGRAGARCRRDRRPAGAAAAHLLFRDDDARLRHHRRPRWRWPGRA